MADIVVVNKSNPNGAKLLQGLAMIRAGFARLSELDGQRAQAIGANDAGATMAQHFGVTSGSAQDLSNRMEAALAFYRIKFGEPGFEYNDKITALTEATFEV